MRLRGIWMALGALGLSWVRAASAVDVTAVLEAMQPVIADCIGRKDTSHPVFHGCWDWHSAAHGHWALFRIARATGRDYPATWAAEASLSVDGLREEEKLLQQDPSFENPYGRAWFLRLAIDFERWGGKVRLRDPDRLRRLADLLSESLLARYRSAAPSPLSREYENASWALTQMHAYFRFTGDRRRLDEVEEAIRRHFVASRETVRLGADRDDFFSLYGNWFFLLARTQPAETVHRFLAERPIEDAELAPPAVTTDHSLGLVWSRAWALSAASRSAADRRNRARFGAAFTAHVARGMENHRQYRENYKAYGHWVPQFAVYAVTEAMEEAE